MRYLPELISLLLGPFTTYVISRVKRLTWSKESRFLAAMLIAFIIGMANAYIVGDVIIGRTLTLDDWVLNAMAVFTSSQAAYKLYFEDSPTEIKIEADKHASQ